MADITEITIECDLEVWTYPSLGTVVAVCTIDGGDPFVLTKKSGS